MLYLEAGCVPAPGGAGGGHPQLQGAPGQGDNYDHHDQDDQDDLLCNVGAGEPRHLRHHLRYRDGRGGRDNSQDLPLR